MPFFDYRTFGVSVARRMASLPPPNSRQSFLSSAAVGVLNTTPWAGVEGSNNSVEHFHYTYRVAAAVTRGIYCPSYFNSKKNNSVAVGLTSVPQIWVVQQYALLPLRPDE